MGLTHRELVLNATPRVTEALIAPLLAQVIGPVHSPKRHLPRAEGKWSSGATHTAELQLRPVESMLAGVPWRRNY